MFPLTGRPFSKKAELRQGPWARAPFTLAGETVLLPKLLFTPFSHVSLVHEIPAQTGGVKQNLNVITDRLWVPLCVCRTEKVISAAALSSRQKSMPHSGLLIGTKLIRLPGLQQLIRQLVNLVNDSAFPKAVNTLFFRKGISFLILAASCFHCFHLSRFLFVGVVRGKWASWGQGSDRQGSAVKMHMLLRSQSRIFINPLPLSVP